MRTVRGGGESALGNDYTMIRFLGVRALTIWILVNFVVDTGYTRLDPRICYN